MESLEERRCLAYATIDLGTLGGRNSGANDINQAGQVVGFANVSGNDQTRATLWNGTLAIDLGTLGGTYSLAHAINNSGQVVCTPNP